MKKLVLLGFLSIALMSLLLAQDQAQDKDNSPHSAITGLFVYGSTGYFGLGGEFFLQSDFSLRPSVGIAVTSWQPSPDYNRIWDKDDSLTLDCIIDGLFEIHPVRNLVVGLGPGFGFQYGVDTTAYNSNSTGNGGNPYTQKTVTIIASIRIALIIQYFFTQNFSAFLGTAAEGAFKSQTYTFSFPNSSYTTSAKGDSSFSLAVHDLSLGVTVYF